jgi:hypothetical protein
MGSYAGALSLIHDCIPEISPSKRINTLLGQCPADEVAARLTHKSRLYTIRGSTRMTLLLSAFAGVFCGLLLDLLMLAITPRHKHA